MRVTHGAVCVCSILAITGDPDTRATSSKYRAMDEQEAARDGGIDRDTADYDRDCNQSLAFADRSLRAGCYFLDKRKAREIAR